MKEIRLDIERMEGYGEYLIDGYRVNYLFGLNDICKRYIKESSIVLELGCNEGISTNLFSLYSKKVVTVDMVLSEKMKKLIEITSNIEFHNTSFNDFFNSNNEKFDFIYIDGSHNYNDVKSDIINSKRFLKKLGIISGHDYNRTCPGVIQAVDEIFGNKNIELFSDSSWVFNNYQYGS